MGCARAGGDRDCGATRSRGWTRGASPCRPCTFASEPPAVLFARRRASWSRSPRSYPRSCRRCGECVNACPSPKALAQEPGAVPRYAYRGASAVSAARKPARTGPSRSCPAAARRRLCGQGVTMAIRIDYRWMVPPLERRAPGLLRAWPPCARGPRRPPERGNAPLPRPAPPGPAAASSSTPPSAGRLRRPRGARHRRLVPRPARRERGAAHSLPRLEPVAAPHGARQHRPGARLDASSTRWTRGRRS